MKFNEFEYAAKQQLAERQGITVDRLDEVLPALAAAARGVAAAGSAAAGAVGTATRAVGQVGSQAAQTGIQAVKKVGAAAVQGASSTGKGLAKKIADKNAQAMAHALLKKGTKLPIPTDTPAGRPEEFEVDDVKGDEVTLKNPKPKPGEPAKTVHKTKDLDPIIQDIVNQNEVK
jgi:hypothetical protein